MGWGVERVGIEWSYTSRADFGGIWGQRRRCRAANGAWRRLLPVTGGGKIELGMDVTGEQMRGRDRMDRIRWEGYFSFSFNSLTSLPKNKYYNICSVL